MPAPLITVLMAVYNGERFVRQSVESVLAQTFTDFEFLIVDDASTDATASILDSVRDPRIRLIRNTENLGLTASLNRGLSLSRGTLIARQDADDFSERERLGKQLAFLTANPPVAAAGTQVRLCSDAGKPLGTKDFPFGHRSIVWSHLFDNALAHSTVLFRKFPIMEAGGYNETFRISQDYELWSRLSERHLLANLPDRLVTLRIVESSLTRTHSRPDLIRTIQRGHGERIFPGRQWETEDWDLISAYRSRVDPDKLAGFYQLFHLLLASYSAAWPEIRISADFARTLSLQYERIGYNLLSTARGKGVREIARAVRVSPSRFFHLPWSRIAALALLGDSARALYGRIVGTRQAVKS